jgi:hypothetical protein
MEVRVQASARSETTQVKMQQLEECVQLNNDALYYIKIGEIAEAHELLHEAESILQKMIIQQQRDSIVTTSQFDVDYERYFKWMDVSRVLANSNDLSSPRSFSLFLHGVWIDSGIPLSTMSTDDSGLATIRLIVQFNFALSCHLLGIQRLTGSSRSDVSNSQEVCQLYQMIQLALDSWAIIPKSSEFGMLMLVAVLNNHACIYSELDLALEHASFYWSRFNTALETMIKYSRLSVSNQNIKLCIYFRLAVNVSLFRGSIAAGAA